MALIVFVAGIALFLFLTFRTNLWLKYPNPFKTQVAFSKLELSSYDNLCHEDCMMEQHMLRKMIADYLVKTPVAMSGQVEDYLLDDEVIDNFKKSLLMILMEAEKIKQEKDSSYKIKAPEYLTKYLNRPRGDMNLKRDILAVFEEQIGLSAGFLDGLVEIIKDETKSVEERISAMNSMINIIGESTDEEKFKYVGLTPRYPSIKYTDICSMLMDILENSSNQDMKYGAVNKLYGCAQFYDNYTLEMFEKLKEIFYQDEIHIGVQVAILSQLYMYKEVNRDDIIEIMEKIYNDNTVHTGIRLEIAWKFKNMGITGYPEPEMSDEDYREFFDRTGDVVTIVN